MPAPAPSSLIDAVDELNRPIGTVERNRALQTGVNFRTVHILVTDDEGRLLVQQLSATRERHALRWGSSVAGYLYAGESYEQGAARRVREELGISPCLHWVGVTSMLDEEATKFVGVFTSRASDARLVDSGHVAALEYWSQETVSDMIHNHPARLTDTFRHVLDFVGGWENSNDRI